MRCQCCGGDYPALGEDFRTTDKVTSRFLVCLDCFSLPDKEFREKRYAHNRRMRDNENTPATSSNTSSSTCT